MILQNGLTNVGKGGFRLKSKKYIIIAVLVVLAVICSVSVAYLRHSDVSAVYTRNTLSWRGAGALDDGSVELELEKGKTRIQLKNDVRGNIGYSIYLYDEEKVPEGVLLSADKMTETDKKEYPHSIRKCDVKYAYSGYLAGGKSKTFQIETKTDAKVSLLIVIEDNNSYPKEKKELPTVANVKFRAEVLLDGQYPRGNDFSFSLKDDEGKVLETVKNDDGYISFSNIGLKENETCIYYLLQNEGKDKEVSYDKSTYKITVAVQDENTTKVSYEKDGIVVETLPRFSNYKEISENMRDENIIQYPTNEKKSDGYTNYLLIATVAIGILIIVFCVMVRKKKG